MSLQEETLRLAIVAQALEIDEALEALRSRKRARRRMGMDPMGSGLSDIPKAVRVLFVDGDDLRGQPVSIFKTSPPGASTLKLTGTTYGLPAARGV